MLWSELFLFQKAWKVDWENAAFVLKDRLNLKISPIFQRKDPQIPAAVIEAPAIGGDLVIALSNREARPVVY